MINKTTEKIFLVTSIFIFAGFLIFFGYQQFYQNHRFFNKDGGYNFIYSREWKAVTDKNNTANSYFGPEAEDESGIGTIEVVNFGGNVWKYIDFQDKNFGNVPFSNTSTVEINGLSMVRTQRFGDSPLLQYVVRENGQKIVVLGVASVDQHVINLFENLVRSFKLANWQDRSMSEFNSFGGGKLLVSDQYGVIGNVPTDQYRYYNVQFPGGVFTVTDLREEPWLKGPNPDEGYVISHENRPRALAILKDIYDNQKISAKDMKQMDEIGGEFLANGYQSTAGMKYFSSDDNSYRGMTFYNLHGGDVSLMPVYFVVLYNEKLGEIIYGGYALNGDIKEIKTLNAPIEEFFRIQKGSLGNLPIDAQVAFKKMVEPTLGKDVSFGSNINLVDNFFKAIHQ